MANQHAYARALRVKRVVYVQKKFFLEEPGTPPPERRNYPFQTKSNLASKAVPLEEKLRLRREATNDKSNPNALFTKLNENGKGGLAEKREKLKSVGRNAERKQLLMCKSDAQITLKPMTLSRRDPNASTARLHSSFLYINNNAFKPAFRIKEKSFQALRKMQVFLDKDAPPL